MKVLAGAQVVTESAVLDPGWVQVEHGRIVAVGEGVPPEPATDDLGGGWLLPGFVDLHVHGGGGGAMDASPEGLASALAYHRSHGTTRSLASVVTAPVEQMAAAAGYIADLVAAGPDRHQHLLGCHFEGPFLSAKRCGAQDVDAMLDPDAAVLRTLLAAGRGTTAMITVAPELPGALELIEQVADSGVIAALGHTDADYDQVLAGFRAGATVLTHTFNAMRGLHHREPGAIGAVADTPGIICEAVNDGIHLHPSAVRALFSLVGQRVAFITDAISAAGAGDGEYVLGSKKVVVADGKATVADGTSIAGSTLTTDVALARSIRDVGLDVEVAARAAATVPARALGRGDEFGAIAAGLAADFVLLDDDFALRTVMAAGSWVDTD